MSVVEQYWGGVLQRLRAEVDVFARLVEHVGERGRMNELALASLLESFVPSRIGVGTGVLIDSHDKQSRQTDVVLYDVGGQPSVMAQTTQVLFPIEVSLASVEVKTTLTSAAVADALKKKKALHALNPVDAAGLPHGHPPFVVLAYDSGLSPTGIVESLNREPDQLPDLICVLEIGLVGGRADVLGAPGDGWTAGLALTQEDTEEGWQWVEADPGAERVDQGGRLVAVVEHGEGTFAADPGRALLLFADALSRLVAERLEMSRPVLSYYLDDKARALAPLGLD